MLLPPALQQHARPRAALTWAPPQILASAVSASVDVCHSTLAAGSGQRDDASVAVLHAFGGRHARESAASGRQALPRAFRLARRH